MIPSQAFKEIPFNRLRATQGYGREASFAFALAVVVILLGHVFFPSWTPFWQAIISLIVCGIVCVLRSRSRVLKKRLETGSDRPQILSSACFESKRPNSQSKLLAWTRSGDVIELVFDHGSWMLVKSDVNDRQWRDVQRLLVWCKRIPSRAVL